MTCCGSLTLRALNEADATAFKALRLKAIEDSPSAIWPTFDEERARPLDVVAAQIRQTHEQIVFGVFDQHMLIAIAGLRQEHYAQLKHKGVLWGVFVDPRYRNVGVARALLNAALAHAPGMQLRQVHLRVNTENHRARRLYATSGFTSCGVEPRAMCVNGRYFDEENMVRYLDREQAVA